jgi:hypothetical protein
MARTSAPAAPASKARPGTPPGDRAAQALPRTSEHVASGGCVSPDVSAQRAKVASCGRASSRHRACRPRSERASRSTGDLALAVHEPSRSRPLCHDRGWSSRLEDIATGSSFPASRIILYPSLLARTLGGRTWRQGTSHPSITPKKLPLTYGARPRRQRVCRRPSALESVEAVRRQLLHAVRLPPPATAALLRRRRSARRYR